MSRLTGTDPTDGMDLIVTAGIEFNPEVQAVKISNQDASKPTRSDSSTAGPRGNGASERVSLHTPATPSPKGKLELSSSGWLQLAKARAFHGRRGS
jgi:hypothetical protein